MRISSIILLCSLVQAAFGQGSTMRGTVTDSVSGDKIPFVTIILSPGNRGAATNLSGFYLVSNLPPGKYTVTVSSVGFKRAVRHVLVVAGEPITVNFILAPEAVEISEVIVTDRAKRELTQINTSVHVLDPSDIRAVPVTLQEDVIRAIQILPGIVSTSDVNSHFYVRGGGGDQNLILLDGIKIFSPFHAFGLFSIFDADLIKATEVYTGAYPPGFGGRLSSVVNMSTRDGKLSRMAAKANANFVSGKLLLEGPLVGHSRFMVNGRKSLFGNSINRAFGKDVPVNFYDLFAKLQYEDQESASQLSALAFFSGDDLRAASPRESDYRWRTSAVGLKASGLLQDRLYVDAVAYASDYVAERLPRSEATTSPTSTSISEFGVRANATYYTDSKDLYFFGFEFCFPRSYYSLINNSNLPIELKGMTVEVALWLRYQMTFDRLKLDGGIHMEVASLFTRDMSFDVIQPRVNASYAFGEDWRLKASYGRFSQQFITVNNEDDVISIFDAWILVSEDLRAEQADHYVLGLDGLLMPSLSFTVQTYYKNFNSIVTYNRNKIDFTDPDYVNSTGTSYGAEFLVRYGDPLVDCYAAYTLGTTTYDVGGTKYPPRHDRRHTINLLTVLHPWEAVDISARWEFGSGFPYSRTIGYYDRLNLGGLMEGSYTGESGTPYIRLGEKNADRLPAYHRLDLSATYRFGLGPMKGNIGIHLINAYDHKNVFYFDRKTGQQVDMLSFFPSLTVALEY